MKLRILATGLLLIALAGGIVGACFLDREYNEVQSRYEEQSRQLQTLDAELEALRLALDNLNMNTAQACHDQADTLSRDARALSEQLEILREEVALLSSYMEENRDAALEAQEELDYLQGVYDALKEGLAQVEGYIAGN